MDLPEIQIESFEDICTSVLILSIKHQLAQTLIHDWVEECKIMEANWSPKDVLQNVSIQVYRTQLILEQAQSQEPGKGGGNKVI